MTTIRCILAFPFGLIAETFARITLWISGGELTVNLII